MEYKPVNLKSKRLRYYIEALDDYQNSLYPPEFNSLDTLETLSKENVYFLGAYNENELCGCCAVKFFQDYAELKRLFINPAYRGKGIAKTLIEKLEDHAFKLGIKVIKTETGTLQTEAIHLYKKLDYKKIGPFGDYIENPYSIFFSKLLKF